MVGSEAVEPAEPRVRMDPKARKELLLATAREVFAEKGYAASGLAEIAERPRVNKRLLYYYFPEGRSELFTAVMGGVMAELTAAIHKAVSGPVNTARRIERLVKTLIDFFEQQPDAFNILFRDPFGVREQEIVLEAVGVQVELAKEFSTLLAPSGIPTSTLLAVAFGTVSYVMKVIEMEVGGEISADDALDACMTCILGVMTQIGMQQT
jgi:AcrR family transcriptional regulator